MQLREPKMHTAEPSAPELSSNEAKVATEKLKCYKYPGDHSVPNRTVPTMRQDIALTYMLTYIRRLE
jgi:hypothetical protein